MDGKIRPLYIQHSAMQLAYHRRSVGYRTSRDRAKFFAAGSRGQWYEDCVSKRSSTWNLRGDLVAEVMEINCARVRSKELCHEVRLSKYHVIYATLTARM